MSLITRCPACETLFRVVPDQLRISEGWVRCGQCDEIFDASYHQLHDAQVQQVVPEIIQTERVDDFEVAEVMSVETPPLDIDLNLDQGMPLVELPEEWSQVAQPLSKAQEAQASTELPAVKILQPELPLLPTGLLESSALLDEDDEVANIRAELGDIDFLRVQKSGAPKHSHRRRVVLLALTLLLLMGLFIQVSVHERDRIAAWASSLKPALQALCAPLNCTLSPLRRLDSIMIESASFTKQQGSIYQLNFLVKNTAATALAVPAIELTLTNSFDQPVVRRVFLAKEFGVQFAEMAAGAEWQASLAVEVKVSEGVDLVVGYRVLAFYP